MISMGFFTRIHDLGRELADVKTLLSLPRSERRIMVYSEDVSSYNQFEGYLTRLMGTYGRRVCYVTSDGNDPLFADHHENMSVYYVNRLVPTLLPRVDSDVFITTMPDLGKLHVERPKEETCCLYIFHSLNSTHEAYRPGAFDHYDVFFCAGAHHTRELAAHFRLHELNSPALHDVGYYKLDRLAEAYRAYVKKHRDKKTILLAPSWGKGNLLASHGREIVERLLRPATRVVVRPHPCFFLPLYPEGRRVVDGVAQAFEGNPNVEIERSIVSEESFLEADLMVSDFSGAAYEFALGTLRPVLFVDGPRKTMNPDWRKLGLPTFEDTMRREVGRIIAADDLGEMDRVAQEMLDSREDYRGRLEDLRQSVVYNFGRSAEVGARIINDILEG